MGKRYDINEKDDAFRWLRLNKVGDYCIRICELASNCCVKKHDKGFDIIVNAEKNRMLIDDMNKWVLNWQIHKMSYSSTEKISSYRIYYFKNHELYLYILYYILNKKVEEFKTTILINVWKCGLCKKRETWKL